jgi:hypothetical protein
VPARVFSCPSAWAILAFWQVAVASLGEDAKDKKKPDADALAAQFKKLDTNGNGFLVKGEFFGDKTGEAKEAADKSFRRKDKDKDLQLTLAEFKAAEKKPNAKKKAKPKAKAVKKR